MSGGQISSLNVVLHNKSEQKVIGNYIFLYMPLKIQIEYLCQRRVQDLFKERGGAGGSEKNLEGGRITPKGHEQIFCPKDRIRCCPRIRTDKRGAEIEKRNKSNDKE